jgi:hypothetical protein
MTAPRTCREPGCQRSTDWPHDPDLLAAYCREHTDGLLLPPREPEVEWMARVRDGRTLLAREYTGAVLAR